MNETIYTFTFPELGGEFRKVDVIDHRRGMPLLFNLTVDDRPELLKSPVEVRHILADLIDLAVGIHAVDRMATSHRDERRRLEVRLPLRGDEFRSRDVNQLLTNLLSWYTDDYWSFEFVKRKEGSRRLNEVQLRLPWIFHNEKPKEVALWSGGLDALAGLCNRLRSDPNKQYFLFGTGSNSEVRGVQRTVAEEVSKKIGRGSVSCSQISIRLEETKDFDGRKNKAPRTRGFVVLLLGAAKALLEDQNRLYVYENGIGAINLAFSGGLHGIDHSRAVHPRSLYLVGEFIEALIGRPFEVINPFVFNTKAWMCEALRRYGFTDLVASTISCDSKPRARFGEKVRHCGSCTSCLLRRQALLAAGIGDETNYATILSNDVIRDSKSTPLRAMRKQIATLEACLAELNSWNALSRKYPELKEAGLYLLSDGESPEEIQRRLVNLCTCYVREWKKCGGSLGWELEGDLFAKAVT